jgi:penicillin-binding protein 1C
VRSGGLLETAWIDERHAQRLRPGCAASADAQLVSVTHARWPTLLEPWIEAGLRSPVERLPLAAPCGAARLSRALRVAGIENGSTLRPTPGSHSVVVQVRAVGSRDSVSWLLDGRLVGTTDARTSGLRLVLDQTGEHVLTALDAQGRYDRVAFTLRGGGGP